jgi:RHS repeat-associated protein
MEYDANKADEVLKFDVQFASNNFEQPELVSASNYYAAGELHKEIMKDENWTSSQLKDKTIEEFKNSRDQTILKRTYNNQEAHDTYYVYDDYDNLTYVLPPLAAEKSNIYNVGSITLPASAFVTGGSPTGSATLGIRQVSPGNFEFFSDFNVLNLPRFYIKTGYIADVPNVHNSLGSYVQAFTLFLSNFSGGIYSYWSLSYYITDGKLYCSSSGYDITGLYSYLDASQPETVTALPQNLQGYSAAQTQIELQNMLNKLCYQYKYDDRNRMIAKKMPGKGWEYKVYDKLDRAIMVNDPNLIADKRYQFKKYDALGREAYTGFTYHPSFYPQRHHHQGSINGGSNPTFETRQSSSSVVGDTPLYYSNSAYPVNNIEKIHTINYYDTYVDLPPGITPPLSVFEQDVTTKTQGLVTVKKVRVLDTNLWITTATYYDEKGRAIYIYSHNAYFQTTDIVENKLDFIGNIVKTRTRHKKSGKPDIVIIDDFEYDNQDRLISQKQTIGSNPQELIVKNHYDELGQLTQKDVGNTEANPLQQTDLTYNIRGWLKTINDPFQPLNGKLFSMELHYKDYGTSLYDGNISAIHWKTASDNANRRYSYTYDDLKRITRGYFYVWGQSNRYSLENISYDKNGNLLTLRRDGAINANPVSSNSSHFGVMDMLSYTYDGNQLLKVDDSANDNFGFIDGTSTANDYAYDGNGNLTKDLNKGIGTTSNNGIIYNHMNLPTQIIFFNIMANINFVYDATGNKLRKTITGSGIPAKKVEYAGNFVYEDDDLQYFKTTEGYVTPTGTGGYDYIYQHKDHLGNVRVSYTKNNNNSQTTVFTDGFENIANWDKSENSFGWALTALDSSRKVSGTYSGRIDDNFPANGERYVYSDIWTPISITEDTFFTVSAWVYVEDIANNDAEIFLATRRAGETGYPTGNYVSDRVVQRGQWVYVEQSVLVPADVVELNVRIDNNKDGAVWFDDVKITQGNTSNTIIVEESNYYPFGLKHSGYNSVVSSFGNSVAQKIGFQEQMFDDELGLNWISFKYRNYDPTISRFFNVDPLTEDYRDWGPYVFSGNRVIDARELEGLEPFVITGRTFIPDKTLSNPNFLSSTDSFRGDNRSDFQLNTTAYRTEQKVRVNIDKAKGDVLNNRANSTIGLDKDGNVVERSKPGIAGPKPTFTFNGNTATIDLEVNASNKLVSVAPAINYEIGITITQNEDGSFSFSIKGETDGFPGYEFFITNEKDGKSYLIYGSNPNETGDGPWSLWPPMEKDVKASGDSKTTTPIGGEDKTETPAEGGENNTPTPPPTEGGGGGGGK